MQCLSCGKIRRRGDVWEDDGGVQCIHCSSLVDRDRFVYYNRPDLHHTITLDELKTKILERENEALRKQNAKYKEALENVEWLSQ